jgi:hypothetical protein
MATAVINNRSIKVLTPTGYREFSAVNRIVQEARLKIVLDNGIELECSLNHPFKDKNGVFVLAKNFIVGEHVQTNNGLKQISSIELIPQQSVLYDLLDVAEGNAYYTNGVVSHNCEFISSDPLLISTLKLNEMVEVPPIYEDEGVTYWEHIDPRKTYLIGMDVSEGLGKDYGTLEMFDLSLKQVAEFRNNKLSEAKQYDKLKQLIKNTLAARANGKPPNILWSFENNACGKVISTLYYNDAKFPEDPELVSIGSKLGMNTNLSTKAEASRDLKRLIEQKNGMLVRSAKLIAELKNYAQKGNNGIYEAKAGATDDLISATLIVTRLFKYVSTYDDSVFTKLYRPDDSEEEYDEDGSIEPMPIGIL